jgi:hypothetical protein
VEVQQWLLRFVQPRDGACKHGTTTATHWGERATNTELGASSPPKASAPLKSFTPTILYRTRSYALHHPALTQHPLPSQPTHLHARNLVVPAGLMVARQHLQRPGTPQHGPRVACMRHPQPLRPHQHHNCSAAHVAPLTDGSKFVVQAHKGAAECRQQPAAVGRSNVDGRDRLTSSRRRRCCCCTAAAGGGGGGCGRRVTSAERRCSLARLLLLL